MSDAITSAPANVLLSSGSGGGLVAVTVTSAAGSAQRLANGGVLEGTVLARPSKGTLELMTADGVVQLKAQPGTTLPNLPPGARLQFQMVTLATGADQLLLTTVNGRALPGMTTGGVIGSGTTSTAAPATTAAGGNATATGGTASAPFIPADTAGLTATVIRSAAGPTGTPAPSPAGTTASPGATPASTTATATANPTGTASAPGATPQPGATPTVAPSPANTTATATPATPAPGMGQTTTTATATATGGTTTASPATTAPNPTAAPPALADLPVGTRLTVRIAAVLPPTGAPTPTATTTTALPFGLDAGQSAAQTLSGTIIAHPPNGNAVVQTALATLSVPAPADLGVGTRLTLEVVGQPQLPLPTAAAATTTAPPPGLTAQGWPALSEALDILAAGNQGTALEQLRRLLPQPDSRLAASMVGFSTALRRRNARALLSEDARGALGKAGRADVADRLAADLTALDEEAGQPVGEGGQWRTYTMPMLSGGMIEPVRLYVRQAKDDSAGVGSGRAGTQANDHRFVLDLHLSQLGRLQLDGLVRRDDKLFDLILRTDAPLTTEMRHDIMAIFTDASELVGTKGTVSFQSGGRWLTFPPAPPSQRTWVEA